MIFFVIRNKRIKTGGSMLGKRKRDLGEEKVEFYKDPSGKIAKTVISVVVALLVLFTLLSGVYSLKENEYAVVTTFGIPKVVEQSGIHLKIPFAQEVKKVPKTINGFPIGYRTDTDESVDSESFMITRDYNFVNVDFYVEYRVTDPVKYLYASESPVDILKMLTQSYIRDTIGLYDVDSVITTGKNEIQASIKEKIVSRLELAKQGKETSINKANQKRNEDIPAARAQADETIKTAQAQAEERINEAKGQVARLNELYAEYQKYPLITKQRMFYETMEDILPDMKVIIEKSDGTTQTMLPLESFSSVGISGISGSTDSTSAVAEEEE